MALIGAGFPYLRHHQQIRSLSGGERSRLLFVGLTLANHSLLLLDEPTNHLDMAGKEELAETLRQFAGAVILVTHDRMLIEQSCNRFWLIDQQNWRSGTIWRRCISAWRAKRRRCRRRTRPTQAVRRRMSDWKAKKRC